jgi:hypothetical protein
VDNLKGGAYTKLPSKWMSNIQSKLTQSQKFDYINTTCEKFIAIQKNYVAFSHLLVNLTKRLATYTKHSWRSQFFS